MADRLNEIKKQVSNDDIMNPPTPSNPQGMIPSIVGKGKQQQDQKQEQIPQQDQENMPPKPQQQQEEQMNDPYMQSSQSPPAGPSMNIPQQGMQGSTEDFQELAESIINEKWEELVSSVGNITLWKEKVQTDISSIKQEILRLEGRFENLQKAVLGRVEEYHSKISDVGSDIKALEQVFEKILQPLTTNIKELGKITEDLKKKKK